MQPDEINALTRKAIGLAIDVHRELGPGLFEATYEECLAFELTQAGLPFERQVPLPVIYKSVRLDLGYRLDIVVENRLILELKTVEHIAAVHEAQMLTYLKLSKINTGLLMNFNSAALKDGIRRFRN
jgi:GxxExxY protein